MQEKLRNYALVVYLFVFLFVIIGGGLHLNPGGAFLAAVSGTPLVIYTFHRRFEGKSRTDGGRPVSAQLVDNPDLADPIDLPPG